MKRRDVTLKSSKLFASRRYVPHEKPSPSHQLDGYVKQREVDGLALARDRQQNHEDQKRHDILVAKDGTYS